MSDRRYHVEPPPRPMRGRPVPSAPPSDLRALRRRIDATSEAIGRDREESQPQTPRTLVTIHDGGAIPTSPDKVYLGYETQIDAPDQEGATPSFATDTNQALPVVVIGQAAVAGDVLVAHAVAGRWVAEKGGTPKPKSACRFICGPYVQFDLPTGCGGGGQAATAAISVAEDGTISDATLIFGGTCYAVAHPNASVIARTGLGSGASLRATVGEITRVAITDGGTGYDPANPPSVTIGVPGTGGTQATATATVDPVSHAVSSATLTNSGAFYQVANPTITIAPPPGAGRRATATATAKPGVVTSLKVTAPGAGYIDNSVPPHLDFTVSCPAWSFSAVLMPGIQPGTAGGYALAFAPPGTLPYCSYSATKKVDIPASGTCPQITGVTMSVIVANTVLDGWCVMIDFTVQRSPTTYPCSGDGVLSALACLELSPSYSLLYPAPHSPTTRGLPIFCTSRPYAQTISSRTGIDDRLYPFGEQGWYTLMGGTCPNQDTNNTTSHQPNIFLNVTLSDP